MTPPAPYISRYRISRSMLIVCAIFIGLAALSFALDLSPDFQQLWLIACLTAPITLLALFGSAVLMRKQGLRVDEHGIFFGGRPPIYRAFQASVPWPAIREIYLFRIGTGISRWVYVGLLGHDGMPLMSSSLPPTVARNVHHVPSEAVRASRPAYGWRLDAAEFKAAVARFAPHLEVTDLSAMASRPHPVSNPEPKG